MPSGEGRNPRYDENTKMGISKEQLDEAYGRWLIAESEIPPNTRTVRHERWQKAMQASIRERAIYNRLKAQFDAEQRMREEAEHKAYIRRLVIQVTGKEPRR
jgi:hypothetical protein